MTTRQFISALNRVGRAAERSHRARIRAQNAQVRSRVASLRENERETKRMEKAEREQYQQERSAEVAEENRHIEEADAALAALLNHAVHTPYQFNYADLRHQVDERVLDKNSSLIVGEAPLESHFAAPLPGFLTSAFGFGKKEYAAKQAAGRQNYIDAVNAYDQRRRQRGVALSALETEVAAHNKEVSQFEADVTAAKPEAIGRYAELVLDGSLYPEGFPQDFRLAYVADSKQLVVEYRLPTIDDVIPKCTSFNYVRTSDKITSKPRPEKARGASYERTIAQVALRTLHELFSSHGLASVETVVFNGYVATIDPATGQKVSPHLLSVRTTRDRFKTLDLGNVEPVICLRSLNASVSRNARELLPVKPILEFDMVDPRFVAEQDILSGLDMRPNLMELTPGEFESLITNLFQQMGLETKLTQASRDGGVDCVAYDARPILGGKVVVQAKRYRHTVGVSAVRDLFGTMHNEGASKGILVTTSGFGKAAFDFANGKPIELINGSNLLYLLKEHAEIVAKIEVPSDWVDSRMDVPELDAT